ncbi:DoxX family protein [Allokutzneria sp. A3M-2-11 16]|uniref:DoxX family protein n=1 Tax=Allokutzneria sp. A3M-2-11 16 TaxID=2962043 RepID=UPI0020B6A1CA|nr:DoxX family protein [Allokutzneria sp. A3M-2-11 16]MCP3803411.1 DoxX family protein [Allokutzneria sp. A3M-2-11 16]
MPVSAKSIGDVVLSLSRGVVGLLFVCHGTSGLFGVPAGDPGMGGVSAFGSWPGWYAAVIQVVCGLLVTIGLATRPAAILCSGSMAFAYFVVHQSYGLLPIDNGGETAALYAWFFLLIAALGPGRYAVDTLLAKHRPHTGPRTSTLT